MFDIIIHLTIYAISFLGGLSYILLYELLSFLINIYQTIFLGYGYPDLSKFVRIDLPDSNSLIWLGFLTCIACHMVQVHLSKKKIHKYRRRRYQLLKETKKRRLPLSGVIFNSKMKKKYERLSLDNAVSHDIKISPQEFEDFIAYYFFRSGFSPVFVTQQSNDYGLDVVTTYRKRTYGIQCKFYRATKKVGVQAVQEVVTGTQAYDLDVPILITTSSFTDDAKRLAHSTGTILIGKNGFNQWQEDPTMIFKILSISRYPTILDKCKEHYEKLKKEVHDNVQQVDDQSVEESVSSSQSKEESR